MKKYLPALILLVCGLFAGCNGAANSLPIVQTEPVATNLPTQSDTPIIEHEFAIYLVNGKLAPDKAAVQSPLELEEEPLISKNDIAAYIKETHEIRLTAEGHEKIQAVPVPTNGITFVVCVNGEQIYSGALWAMYSSLSFDRVVIDPLQATADNPTIQLTLGYPTSTFFSGDDPRSDPRILQALEEMGKLE